MSFKYPFQRARSNNRIFHNKSNMLTFWNHEDKCILFIEVIVISTHIRTSRRSAMSSKYLPHRVTDEFWSAFLTLFNTTGKGTWVIEVLVILKHIWIIWNIMWYVPFYVLGSMWPPYTKWSSYMDANMVMWTI